MQLPGGAVDLERLALSSGQARSLELELKLDEVRFAAQSYRPDPAVTDAVVDVSRTVGGYALRLRFATTVIGPCVRCLTETATPLKMDTREVDQPGTDDEELRSPYIENANLDVAHWANDAMVLALPTQPLCREDCAGLCAVCGARLNDADGPHDHGGRGDPRMAKLRDLKLD